MPRVKSRARGKVGRDRKAAFRVLGIETSGSRCSVAHAEFPPGGRRNLRELWSQAVVFEEVFDEGLGRHSEVIYGLLDRVFKKSGSSFSRLSLIAVSAGPGSFTGLRVGVAIAKVFAKFGGMSLIGIPTLEAMAGQSALGTASPRANLIWVPCLEAKRDEVYSAFYRERNGRIVKEMGPWVGTLSSLMTLMPKGACLVREQARASITAVLGMEKYLAGHRDDPDRLVPFYLKRPEAVEKLRSRRKSGRKAWTR